MFKLMDEKNHNDMLKHFAYVELCMDFLIFTGLEEANRHQSSVLYLYHSLLHGTTVRRSTKMGSMSGLLHSISGETYRMSQTCQGAYCCVVCAYVTPTAKAI